MKHICLNCYMICLRKFYRNFLINSGRYHWMKISPCKILEKALERVLRGMFEISGGTSDKLLKKKFMNGCRESFKSLRGIVWKKNKTNCESESVRIYTIPQWHWCTHPCKSFRMIRVRILQQFFNNRQGNCTEFLEPNTGGIPRTAYKLKSSSMDH